MSNAQNQDKINPQAAGRFKCKTFCKTFWGDDTDDDIDMEVMNFIKDFGITKDKLLNYTPMVVHTGLGPRKYVHIAWYDDPEIT